MLAYIIRRLLLIIPTLFGIMVVNFIIVQAAPGGPVEQLIAQIQGTAVEATARFGSGAQSDVGDSQATRKVAEGGSTSKYRGAQGLEPEFIADLERQFGFDKPLGAALLRDSALAYPQLQGGLLEQVREARDRAEIQPWIRRLVGRSGLGGKTRRAREVGPGLMAAHRNRPTG